MNLQETEFRRASDRALENLNRALGTVADEHDVEVLYQNGVLTLEFEDPAPAKIVISPNGPVSQIWISAQATSFKLGWDRDREDFVYPQTDETLETLVGRLVGEELGTDPITL